MRRKLVKQGAATMMISLPSKWIKENKLGKGSEVSIEEKNNLLIIGSESKARGELSLEINEKNKRDIKSILTHVYRKGFDKITLKGDHKEVLKEVKQLVSSILLGFEITELMPGKLVIENISEPTGQKYDLMLKKVFQTVEETQEILIESFDKNEFKNLEDVEDLLKQHDRFSLFCRRLLIKENTGKIQVAHWELHSFLMHIEHRLVFLYRYAAQKKIVRNKEILTFLKDFKHY